MGAFVMYPMHGDRLAVRLYYPGFPIDARKTLANSHVCGTLTLCICTYAVQRDPRVTEANIPLQEGVIGIPVRHASFFCVLFIYHYYYYYYYV